MSARARWPAAGEWCCAGIASKQAEILALFDTPDPVSDPITEKLTREDLHTAARVAVALDKFVELHELDAFAYYHEGEPGSKLREIVTNLIVGNSLLTAAGFPMCGESDLKTCIAMMIMDRLDIGGSFAEFHPIDYQEGFVLVGHTVHITSILPTVPAKNWNIKGKLGTVDFTFTPGANSTRFIGTEGWVEVRRSGIDAEPKALLQTTIAPGDYHLAASARQDQNFLDAVKSRRQPVSHIVDAVRSDLISLLFDLVQHERNRNSPDQRIHRKSNAKLSSRPDVQAS